MGNVGRASTEEGEATIISMSDDGEALLRFPGGARMTLALTVEQLASYRQGQLRERARAGTLGASARPANQWPHEGRGSSDDDELVLGDRNWFYC